MPLIRETETQLHKWTREGVLAVEMQAASLFCLWHRQASFCSLGCHGQHAVDHAGAQFDTGSPEMACEFSRGSPEQPISFAAS